VWSEGAQVIHQSSWSKQRDSICLDNASAMLGALDDLVATYPHLYKQGCCAHILDLLLKDWRKEEMFKTLVTRAKQVCIYTQIHHATMALYRHYSTTLSLKVPSETRFECNFLIIACMFQLKDALKRMGIDPRWNEYVSTLFNRQNGHHAYALVGTVRATINTAFVKTGRAMSNCVFHIELQHRTFHLNF
jgi:hypothetical protein